MAKIIQDIAFLRTKSESVTSVDEAKSILLELEDTLKPLTNGVGLAAIQIGYAKKIGAIKKPDGTFIHLINPEFVEGMDEFIFLNEGCLSFPEVFRDTKRYRQVIIKNKRIEDDAFQDEVLSFYYSTDVTEPGNDGLIAIAVQHELEHFEGMTILNHNIVSAPIVRESVKIGRNDPCPCGSSKKYKKCCGKV
jgi:peptide deformylase